LNHAAILALDATLKAQAADEQTRLVDFLHNLDILDREHAYAGLNCGSAFEYLVRVLHYAEGTAWDRVNAVRVMRKFPQLEAPLRDRRLNTTQLLVLGPVLTPENVQELIERATRLSKTKTKELVVSIRPKEVPADGLRKLPTASPRLAVAPPSDASSGPCLDRALRNDNSPATPAVQGALVPGSDPGPRPLGRSFIEPVSKDRWQWRVGLDAGRKAKLDTLRGYLGHKIFDGDLQKIFDQMLDDALEKHGKRLGFVEPKHPRKPSPPKPPTPGKRAPIPRWVRRAVLKRDGYQCTESGPDGERCPCKDRLELDHRNPANVTGSSTVDDLTTKCRAHNLYRAMRRYGIDYVRRRIEEARREREARRSAKAASNTPTLCEPVAPWGAGGSAAVA